MKFTVSHYKKANSALFVNGGRLTVTDTEYVLKCLFWTVARFSIDNVYIHRIPNYAFFNGIRIVGKTGSFDLYFYPSTAKRLFALLKL